MKRIFAVGSIILLFILAVKSADTYESIEKQRSKKVEKARKYYIKTVKKINADAIRRHKALLKRKTRSGKLEEAVKIKNRITALESGADATLTIQSEEETRIDPDNDVKLTGKSTDREHIKRITKRYKEFHKLLLDKDFDRALLYLDPNTRKVAGKHVLKGYLNIMAGALQAHNISAKGIDIEKITLGSKRKDAKVIGRFRVGLGRWYPGDPAYWIYEDGNWYLGDDKKLADFK